MTRSWKAPLLPFYLATCLVLGGSTDGVWTNFALQVGAVALIAVSLATRAERPPRRARHLMAIILAALLLIAIQLIPLPPALWSALPGRGFVVRGLTMIGQPLPWMPLSLAPAQTLTSASFLLPPFAILLWFVRGGPLSLRASTGALLGVGLAGAILGLRQMSSHSLDLYAYQFSSYGNAPGFFANSSHMAELMLGSIPFLAALLIDLGKRKRGGKQDLGVVIGALALFAILVTLVAINASGAVLLLSAPVLFLTIALWGGRGVAWLRRLAVPLLLVSLAGAIALTYLSGRTLDANTTSVASRSTIWLHSREALTHYVLPGSGIGTFVEIYQRFEPAATIESTYINHAHNDYLEMTIETGVPGVLLILLFLGWWVSAAWSAWRGPFENVYARAATIASGAVLLHEIVEYPLRSPAITVFFALCVGLMAVASTLPAKRLEGDLWAARHIVIE